MPALVPMQQIKQTIVHILMNSQISQAKEPTPVIELAVDDPVQGMIPVTNADIFQLQVSDQ